MTRKRKKAFWSFRQDTGRGDNRVFCREESTFKSIDLKKEEFSSP